MKVRDSGMPDADYWETLFNVPLIIKKMQITSDVTDLAEVGCGYGTFTVPAARVIKGTVYAFDIEQEMVAATSNRADLAGAANIKALLRDTIVDGTGLSASSVDYVMLFNILHHEHPVEILTEAMRILKTGGVVGCVHWNYDSSTPRGPTMDIRPKPEQIREWMASAVFHVGGSAVDLPPYHYGWLGRK